MDWLFVILSTILGAVLWYLVFGQKKERRRLINRLPGPKAYPLLGNMLELMVSSESIIHRAIERFNKYGPIFRLWLGAIPIVSLASPEYLEIILSSQKELNKGFMYDLVRPWLGDGLLTSTGKRWFKHRKMLTPAFHFSILETFLPVFESSSGVFIKKLSSYADTDKAVDISPFITKCTLDMICETAMGIKLKAQEESDSQWSEYTSAIYKFSRLVVKRGQRIYLHSDKIFRHTSLGHDYYATLNVLHDFTNKTIRQRKVLREEQLQKAEKERLGTSETKSDEFGTKKRKAFLDLLLDFSESAGLTEEQIREEVDTFMFEGHDTTSTNISWTVYMLGLHPEIQEQVYQEIKYIYGDDPSRNLLITDLNEMKLLERCIKETLRLYPSVPFVSRRLENDTTIGEYLIPENTIISVAIMNLHRNPNVWPDPKKYDPDRFLPENIQKRHPFSFLPFSAGPRNCIGQKFALYEEKILLSRLFYNYRIESIEKESDIIPLAELILRPKNGVRVKIYKR